MNIFILLCSAIATIISLNATQNQLKDNNSTIQVSFNVQSPQSPMQQPLLPVKDEKGFITSVGSLVCDYNIMSTCYNRRYFIATTLLLCGYGYILYTLNKTHRLIEDQKAWCNWKNHIELERLVARPALELSQELLLDIQKFYINSKNPTDFIVPLASFLPTIEKEEALLQDYLSTLYYIMTCKCSWFFRVTQKQREKAASALQRLQFIKELYIEWWARHNSNKNFLAG